MELSVMVVYRSDAMCVSEIIEQEVLSLAASSPAASKTNDRNNTTQQQEQEQQHASDILDSSKFDLKLDKSNILMLGPTGSGEYNICISVYMSVLWFPTWVSLNPKTWVNQDIFSTNISLYLGNDARLTHGCCGTLIGSQSCHFN